MFLLTADREGSVPEEMLTEAERRTLLAIARASMRARVAAQTYVAPPGDGALAWTRGAFVTLWLDETLRGLHRLHRQ